MMLAKKRHTMSRSWYSINTRRVQTSNEGKGNSPREANEEK
jgi:hypothetical protein